jgi:hypothetical protein
MGRPRKVVEAEQIKSDETSKHRIIVLARSLLVELLIPFVTWMGKIKAPFSDKKAIDHFFEIQDHLNPGDVILSTTLGELSNWFNPGKYKHAIIFAGWQDYKGYKNVPMVMEAIGQGVLYRSLAECLATKDKIVICEPRKPLTPQEFNKGFKWALKQVGKPYDYRFEVRGENKFKNFYCSEYYYDFIKKCRPTIEFTLMYIFGVATVKPMDFYNAKAFRTKWEMDVLK